MALFVQPACLAITKVVCNISTVLCAEVVTAISWISIAMRDGSLSYYGGKPITTGGFLSEPLLFKQLFEICAFLATGIVIERSSYFIMAGGTTMF